MLEGATPYLFAGLCGALAVAAGLTAAAFHARARRLSEALEAEGRWRARDLTLERVFLVEMGRLTPASPATERALDAALQAAPEVDDEERGALHAFFETDAADRLEADLRRLVGDGARFERLSRALDGTVWVNRGELAGAQALLRQWPAGDDAATHLSGSDAAAPLDPAPATDRMSQAEDEEADAAGLLAHGLEAAASGVLLFDEDGRLAVANAAARRLLRLRPETVAKQPTLRALLDAVRDSGRLPERRDYRPWRDAIVAAPVEGFAAEGLWALPDRSALRITARTRSEGGLALVVVDETDAIALERRYQIAMGARRATFAAIENGLAVIGADGRLHLANPAFAGLWGLDARLAEERAAGQTSLAQLAREASRDPQDAAIWARIQEAAPMRADGPRRTQRFTASRSEDRRLSVAVAPLPEGAVLISCTDVSAEYRVERALLDKADVLEAADRMKADFLNDIALQLRNPLNSIIGFTEMLRQGMAGSLQKRQDEYLGYVLAAAQDLRELLSDALDLGALNAGALSLRRDRIDVGAIGEGVMALLAKRAERRGATFAGEIDDAPMPVAGDETRLRHALYTAGSAVIAAAAAEDRVAAALSPRRRAGDDGRPSHAAFGVRLERRNPIEDDRAEPIADAGGVALSLAKRIVEVHGGRVFFGETPERVEVILEFPLIVETTEAASQRRALGAPARG